MVAFFQLGKSARRPVVERTFLQYTDAVQVNHGFGKDSLGKESKSTITNTQAASQTRPAGRLINNGLSTSNLDSALSKPKPSESGGSNNTNKEPKKES